MLKQAGSSTWRNYAIAWILLNTVLRQLIVVILFGLIWLINLASRLHVYEVHAFAAGVRKAFDPDYTSEQILPALSRLEGQISSNINRASCSWVRCSLFQVFAILLAMLMLFVPLLRFRSLDLIAIVLIRMLYCSFFAIVIAWPLASVSTAYEIDVLRGLNDPHVLHLAQRHLTSQFLLHIRTLNWGFLIGDEPFKKSMLVNAGVSVFVALCVGTTNSIINQL